jgi:glutathione S-transferase
MKLYYTPTSPFVRKVMVMAHETGLAGRIETTLLRPTPTKADPGLSHDNPLSKIPALITDDGLALYDSPVICEYLDSLHAGPKLIPARGAERFQVLRRQALGDGILEAAVLVFYERTMRPAAHQWASWISGQIEKATQGLDAVEREVARSEKRSTSGRSASAPSSAGSSSGTFWATSVQGARRSRPGTSASARANR